MSMETVATMAKVKDSKAFTYEPDFDNYDGMFVYKNAKTLDRYQELKQEASNVDLYKYDMFVAFSVKDFKEEAKKIRSLKKGEKYVSIGGGIFGTRDGVDKYFDFLKSIDKKIAAECDPEEVYVYEYNNYESAIAYDGDMNAIKTVASYFGWDVAKKIKRYTAYHSFEEMMGGNK